MMTGYFDILAVDTIERRLEFANLPEGWAAVGLIALLAGLLFAVVYLYRHEQRAGASMRARTFLAGLRCSVLVLLGVIWLEPVLATYIHRSIEAVTLLLVDGSASMSLRDPYPRPDDAERVGRALAGIEGADATAMSRADIMRAVLGRGDAKVLDELAANNPVEVYRFGDRLISLGRLPAGIGEEDGERGRGEKGETGADSSAGATSQPADSESDAATEVAPGSRPFELSSLAEAGAPETNVGQAVRQAIEARMGKPIAAVVVFSDGQFNDGDLPAEVARYARSKRLPIHVVGVGDPSPMTNVNVYTVDAPPYVYADDSFKVTADILTQGLGGETITVELLERIPNSDATNPIESKQVTVGTDGTITPLVFSHRITEADETRLVVRVAPQPGEAIIDDNLKAISVRKLQTKMRVLLVAGAPSWEYRYLSRLLQRDKTVNLSCWLQSADETAVRDGDTVIGQFPREREELAAYDCIVLLDPHARDFDPAWTQHVEDLIDTAGAGLLYVAGRKNTPRFAHSPNAQPLFDLLPVVFDTGKADIIINELHYFQPTAWPVEVPAAVANHPILTVSAQPGENARIWGRLPGVYWHYPVRREKPVATALLRHSNPRMRNAYDGHVLLATQFLGAGRTGYLGFETTWRWRRFGEQYFNRFWVKLLRHLAEGKLLSGQKRGLVQFQTEGGAYTISKPIEVEARLLDTRYLPLEQPQVEATIRVDADAVPSVKLEVQPDRPGWYRGRFVPTRIGTHELTIDLPGSGGVPAAAIRGEVHVGRPNLEFRKTELARGPLRTLAAGSSREPEEGVYLDIDEVDKLPSLIASRSTSLILTGPARALWDRWWTLMALVTLLGIEWAVRKRARLL